jgi:hypothetical protein
MRVQSRGFDLEGWFCSVPATLGPQRSGPRRVEQRAAVLWRGAGAVPLSSGPPRWNYAGEGSVPPLRGGFGLLQPAAVEPGAGIRLRRAWS